MDRSNDAIRSSLYRVKRLLVEGGDPRRRGGAAHEPRRGLEQSAARGGMSDAVREAGVIDEIAAEFSTEELLEFLEADQRPGRGRPRVPRAPAQESELWRRR